MNVLPIPLPPKTPIANETPTIRRLYFSSASDGVTKLSNEEKLSQLAEKLPKILIPGLDLQGAYHLLPNDYRKFVDNALGDPQIQQHLQKKDLNLAAEYGDVLWERFEFEDRAPDPEIHLGVNVSKQVRKDMNELIETKRHSQPSRPTHLLEEVIEAVDESPMQLEYRKYNAIANLISPTFTNGNHLWAQMNLGLPSISPDVYLKYEVWKLKGRSLLQAESPQFNYDRRKQLLAPFEKLISAHLFGPYLEN